MIKGISSPSSYITVTNGTPSPTYINAYSNSPGIGNMRWNPSSGNIEIYDGNTWVMMYSAHATVDLGSEAKSILDWARLKMAQEQAWEASAEKNETVRIALDNVLRAEKQLETTIILSEENDKTTAS